MIMLVMVCQQSSLVNSLCKIFVIMMMSDMVLFFFDCFRLCGGVTSTAKRDALSENVAFQAASTNKGKQPGKVIKFRPPTDSTRATHRVSL